MMLYTLVGLAVLSLVQTVALAQVYLRTRETSRLDDRLAHFAEALAKGQPSGGKIALTLFRDKLNEII